MYHIEALKDLSGEANVWLLLETKTHKTVASGTREEMEALRDERNARVAERQAKVSAWKQAGYVIERDLPKGKNRYRFLKTPALRAVDAAGNVAGRWASIDEMPAAPEAPAETPVTAPTRGTITDAQIHAIWQHVQSGDHEGCWADVPNTLEGIQALSKEQASQCIEALRNN